MCIVVVTFQVSVIYFDSAEVDFKYLHNTEIALYPSRASRHYRLTKLRKMSLPSPKLKFNNGEECPQFGLGTWLSDKGKVRDAVEHAIAKGYRHVDAAWIYGNEGEVGEAIETSINKESG